MDPRPGDRFLDLTVGAGGHASAILQRVGPLGLVVGLDRDRQILEVAASRLNAPNVRWVHGSFGDLEVQRSAFPTQSFDMMLLDLGVSSLQLDRAERGFSFRRSGPLDMRMDPTQGPSARDVVRDSTVEQLAEWIRDFGEERHALRVARAIVEARGRSEITTTGELAEIVRRVVPSSRTGIDGATRTFQALRIAVNGELDALDRFLTRFDPWLDPGGRLVILTYHSLEDRRVKQAFRQRVKEGDYESLTKGATRPSSCEVLANPRARSAKLRGLRKREAVVR